MDVRFYKSDGNIKKRFSVKKIRRES